jgi:hypothetical protein
MSQQNWFTDKSRQGNASAQGLTKDGHEISIAYRNRSNYGTKDDYNSFNSNKLVLGHHIDTKHASTVMQSINVEKTPVGLVDPQNETV